MTADSMKTLLIGCLNAPCFKRINQDRMSVLKSITSGIEFEIDDTHLNARKVIFFCYDWLRFLGHGMEWL